MGGNFLEKDMWFIIYFYDNGGNMIKIKKYTAIDSILIPLKIIPMQTFFFILYAFLNAMLPTYQTIVVARFINVATDIFDGKKAFSSIYQPIFLIICYVIFTELMPIISEMVDSTARNRMNLILKKEIINKKARLEYKHMENHQSLELIDRVCADPVANIMDGFNNILNGMTIIVSSASLLLIVMSSTFGGGLAILLVSIPLLIIAMRTGKKNYAMEQESKNIQRRYNYLVNILTNRECAEERQLFNYSKSIRKKFNNLYDQSYKIERKIQIKSFINFKSGSMITLVLDAIIIAILLPSFYRGQISTGLFVALVNAILGLVQSMSWRLASAMMEYTKLKEYMKDFSVFISLSEKNEACSLPLGIDDFIFETLEFDHVSFKYPGTDTYILKNCSFVLESGKSYSFVGINGAGKTTITKLITGLYDEYEGKILINGKNMKEYKYCNIKSLISVVFQDFAKYGLTIKENIHIGNILDNSEAKINQVIQEIGLQELVNDVGINKYLRKIMEDSIDISGGQWQRIAIARLLFSNAPINILDEPTASLDPISESKVYKLFNKINKNRFTIYITHRLGAAKIADEILVVADGYIVEKGSHKELMRLQNGIYHKMFESQKSWYETND